MNTSWQPLTPDSRNHIPAKLHHWLIDTGSLTAKLRHLCHHFSVHLIQQTQRIAQPHEARLLELDPGASLIDREVQLYCNTNPVVYARSLIPLKAISDRFQDLDAMGEQPLGEKIFSDPQLQRSPIEWCLLTYQHPLFQHAIEKVTPPPLHLYGRRSLFYGAARPIMISEFFLPAILSLER